MQTKLEIKSQLPLRDWLFRWRQFNLKLYAKDFNKTLLFVLLAIFSGTTLFEKPLKQFINYFLVNPIISYCEQNQIKVDLMFVALTVAALSYLLYQLSKKIVPTLNSFLFAFTFGSIYILFFRVDKSYIFYNFLLSPLRSFFYTDAFFFSLTIFSFSFKSYLNPLQKPLSQYTLIEDYPSHEKYPDLYGSTNYAATIASHILNTSTDTSFAIGIIGEWGSGKSDFMIRLKYALKKFPENILIDFNPWRVNKADAIVEEFFKTLSKQLSLYNPTVTKTITEYSNRVLQTAKEVSYKLIDTLITKWFGDDDIQKKYEEINTTIKSTGKRIVIFIDDVDRLTGKEVMEVLRIIRNTANFANTFFVIGIDQTYIVNVLRNTKDFSNEEEYLKKVFQLTITLPAFKKEVFISEIKKHLFTSDLSEDEKKNLSDAFSRFTVNMSDPSIWFFPAHNHEYLLESMLDNIRDVKRFCNSFKIVYNLLSKEADLNDLIVLELIRNKSTDLYNAIRSKHLLSFADMGTNKYALEADKWTAFESNLTEKDRSKLKRAVDFLLSDGNYKNQRKFIYPHNFYIYFAYQLFNQISFSEFTETLKKDTDDIVTVFQKWIDEGKEAELFKVVSYLDEFEDAHSFKKIVIVLLRLYKEGSNYFEQVKQWVCILWKFNHKKYFQSDDEQHRQFLLSILADETIDRYVRALLAHLFVHSLIEDTIQGDNLFITQRELQRIIYRLFSDYLDTSPTDPIKTIQFYYLNDYKRVNGYVILYPPAGRRFKRYLLTNPVGFEGYVRLLLRPYQHPYNGKLVLEPWIEQIFPDWHVFEHKMSITTFTDSSMDRLRQIILPYLNPFFASNRTPFEIKNKEDQNFVDNFLQFGRRTY